MKNHNRTWLAMNIENNLITSRRQCIDNTVRSTVNEMSQRWLLPCLTDVMLA